MMTCKHCSGEDEFARKLKKLIAENVKEQDRAAVYELFFYHAREIYELMMLWRK